MEYYTAADFTFRKGRPPSLPPFVKPEDLVAETVGHLALSERITVTEAATKYRRLNDIGYSGPWQPEFAPYIREPADAATDRRFKAGVFVGPSRTVKTSGIIENGIAYFAKCSPRAVSVIAADQLSAKKFSEKKFDPMLRASPDLKAQQETGRGADNIYQKLFRGGMIVDFLWPTGSNLAMVDIPVLFITEYDLAKLDIGEEGDFFTVARKRAQSYGSLGWVLAETSPRHEITDPDWYAKTPHEAPPCRGALSHYNDGTRGRYYWDCLHCGERFEPQFNCLKYSDDSEQTPAERALSTVMICPNNGCILNPSDKVELNRNGYWLHEATDDDNGGLCRFEETDRLRITDTVSWWMNGTQAALQSWGGLVETMIKAEEKFESLAIETDLKAATYTTLGLPYLSKIQENESELNAGKLWDRADERALGVLPKWTRFIAVSVDVQNARFPVQVTAFGSGLECATVDRFDLALPPESAPGAERDKDGNPRRQLAPALYLEDWSALEHLEARVWPVDGEEYGLRPLGVTIDYVGEPGVTDNCRKFWRAMRKKGLAMRFHPCWGQSTTQGTRVWRHRPDSPKRNKKKDPADVPVLYMASNLLKDEVSAGLLRDEDGPNRYHLTKALGRKVFDEFCSEERVDGKWSLKSGVKRNEAFDLAYHAKALAVQLGAERIDWAAPPDWALPGEANALAVSLVEENLAEPDIDPVEGTDIVKPSVAEPLSTARAKRFAAWAKMRTSRQ